MVRGGCRKGFWEGDEDRIPQLTKDAAAADADGLQVIIHAIGQNANAVVLDIFERTRTTNGKRDRRFRIEHANGVTDADRQRFAAIPVIASFQPHLFRSSADQIVKFDSAGVRLAFGSDAAMTDMNPLLAIRDSVVGTGGRFTVEDAVRAYTVGSAYAEFQENIKGTIEAEKYADLVMLSEDIFTIEPAKIAESRVVMTITAGRVVYQAK
jgi:predicted amidohydrolase YtcJ